MTSMITLTTDFGARDGYVAQMKGVIYTINPGVTVIDVTHDIQPFDIVEGALVLKGLARYYPEGTIHVAVVDPGVGGTRRGLALRCGERIYLGPDNGLFSLVLRAAGLWHAREIRNRDYMRPDPHPTFHGRDVFAPVAAHLSAGAPFEVLGPEVADPVLLHFPEPIRTDRGVNGEIVHVDRFGNLATNIDASMLDKPFAHLRAGTVYIRRLSRYFGEVDEGRPLALINSFGYLEISVNRRNASEVLGIGRGDKVRLRWSA
ncbi:MAG: SAM-dependent chlorinase/fluorinase [Deltaproteobacteria bacterium]|nr:SAM-dependent chlorinase/fluorinase [Deltaproteobacteria bacterium]